MEFRSERVGWGVRFRVEFASWLIFFLYFGVSSGKIFPESTSSGCKEDTAQPHTMWSF